MPAEFNERGSVFLSRVFTSNVSVGAGLLDELKWNYKNGSVLLCTYPDPPTTIIVDPREIATA